ncbi:BQ2448_777 [Microbotryum intermedium]|uniref:BQ2448_777 protein n=1 Tax=Microbotryum intermedium TaxID=269621 RepID=A0A238FC55_9BASI|nr:BQ2448_777 [Microbotryum intermedium]
MSRQRTKSANRTMDPTSSSASGPAVPQAGEATPLVAKTHKLLTYDELEDWRKDNHYIRTAYRQTLKSYHACFLSIFGVHNETTNIASAATLPHSIERPHSWGRARVHLNLIQSCTPLGKQWTHLVGAIVAIGSLLYLVASITPDERARHRQGWFAPVAGIPYPFPSPAQPSVTWIDSFGFSASFHALCCHSKEVAHRWNNFDYVGIVVLISGTFVPVVRYGFFCDPHLRHLYITLIYTAASFTAYTVLAPHAKTPEFRRFRAWVFIALGASAVFPVGHAILRYGFEGASNGISLPWLALGGALYIIGAVLYAERCPERFLPGRFDLVGSSHQIFHVLILLAALSHWVAISEGFRYWHGERNGGCPVHS